MKAFSTFSDLSSTEAQFSVTDDEAILLVKQAGDGVTMGSFLSDDNYDNPLNYSSIPKILKKNYKSDLLKKISRNVPERLTVRFLNLYGDVLFWIKHEQPLLFPPFDFLSAQWTSSHEIHPSPGFQIHKNSYYWQQAKDKNGTWFAIFEGFDVVNKSNYPKLFFSRNKSRPYEMAREPFVFTECYNITYAPQSVNFPLQTCHTQCESRNYSHMAIGLNEACHCGQYHSEILADGDKCPMCRQFPALRCPTARHTFAGYLLHGVEASVIHDVTYNKYEVNIDKENTTWPVSHFRPDLTPAFPLYINTGVRIEISHTVQANGVLYYSPRPDCSLYKKIKETNDVSVVIPVYCLRFSHHLDITKPLRTNIVIPIPTGGNFFSAQKMVITGEWNPTSTTDTATFSELSSSMVTPRTTNVYVNCKPCICVNNSKHLTTESIKESLHEIKKKLLLPQKNLSSYARRLRSADDSRRSAADMGYVGMAVIISCVFWIVSTDITYVAMSILRTRRKY
ncbi:uncharacterized protein LOC125645950 [Ostrea edulis]|uniref:uncharacterized protein LOC125645950 n=1 Tax=Ostrea edulis TaxID=37623 RepID=UPI0024AE8DA8|nr:uncharacterized protein LOC125645950 [Ostrea edulis]